MTATTHAPDRPSRVDAEAVAVAALALMARGEMPSSTAVQRELGRGSMSTVSKHLKAWAATQMPGMAGKASLPKWSSRELEAMATLRRIFREEAAAALAERRAQVEQEVKDAETAVAEAREQTRQATVARERAEDRASGLDASVTALTEQLTSANRAAEQKDAQIERLQGAGAEATRQYERTVEDLRRQMTDSETRFKGLERHLLKQIDEDRQSHAVIKGRMEQDLTMANARLSAATTATDKMRAERDDAEARFARAQAAAQAASRAQSEAERRVGVAEGQVATMVTRVEELAASQAALSNGLLAAQARASDAEGRLEPLRRTAAAVLEALPAPKQELTAASRGKLTKAAEALRALLSPAA